MKIGTYSPIQEANVWTNDCFNNEDNWVIELSKNQIFDIKSAIRAATDAQIAPQNLQPNTFPVPSLRKTLTRMYEIIEDGRGFVVLRGWPSDEFSRADNLLAFCGIASYFGQAMVQNYEGEQIVDVTDKNKPYDHTSRGYMSNRRLPFHSDGADLVGLLCLGEPAEGGTSLLLSATNLFNIFLDEKPEYLKILEDGFFHHRRGQHDPGESPLSPMRIPVFSFSEGLLHCCYNRNPIEWVVHEGVQLSDKQIEVIDYFDALCQRPGMAVEMKFQRGDMQFVNNFVILHSRTAYRDDANNTRHLVRLWLENTRSKRGAKGLLDIYVPGSSKIKRECFTK